MTDARFVLSAASASDFPQDGPPEVALVGRSNVGKSSLINALVGTKLARTSAAPGKTRLINFYRVGLSDSRFPASAKASARPRRSPDAHSADEGGPNPDSRQRSFYLVDLPGYGYARGGATASEGFKRLAGEYFTRGRRIAGVLHVIDARHPDLPQDAAAHHWLVSLGLPLAVVATKADKLNRTEREKTARRFEKNYPGIVLLASAFENEGTTPILKMIRSWV